MILIKKKIRSPFKTIKVIKGKKPKRYRIKYKTYIIMFLFFILFILSYRYVENELMSTVVAIADMKIRTISTNIISNAIDEILQENNINTESLVTYYYDEEGKIISIGINSVLINLISSGVIKKVSSEIDAYNSDKLSIPIGRLMGKSVFSNFGPKIKIKILPYGTVTTSYDSSFTSTGINQINHRIWLNVEMTMQVIIPINTAKVKVNQEVTLVDRVINGDVPNQYIVVPGLKIDDEN